MTRPPEPPPSDPPAVESAPPTTLHANRAVRGDAASLEWIVKRFTPLLIAQGEFRLPAPVRATFDVEDLVNETWAIALPKLDRVPLDGARVTPRLLRFLTATLLNVVNNVARKYARTEARRRRDVGDRTDTDPLARQPSDRTGVVSAVVRDERRGAVYRAIEALDARDRDVILVRAIEQHPNPTAAMLLGLDPKATATRYHRALKRLRAKLPDSVFGEL